MFIKKRSALSIEDYWVGFENTHKGCKLSIPKFEAIAPVINGRRALPPAPQATIHPTVPFTRWRGRTCAVWFIAMGYIGPKRMPITETEIAPAVKEGTSQTINWKLSAWWVRRWNKISRGVGLHLQYCEEGITINGVSDSHLWLWSLESPEIVEYDMKYLPS